MALLRLFDPTTQFQTKSGALNVAGKLRIYVESTDDLANIYGDDGSRLPQPLILDSNGRARGLFVDSGLSYRLEAYDRNDSLLFTIRRLEPNASGTIINPMLFIKGTPDEIDVEDSVTEKNRTYTVSLSAKVTGKIAENQEAILKESEARKAALDDKVDKVEGKGLSTEDYTTADKTKLDGIATGAEANVQADWDITNSSSDAFIKNKPYYTKYTTKSTYYKVCSFPETSSSSVDISGLQILARYYSGGVNGRLIYKNGFRLYYERVSDVYANTQFVKFHYVTNGSKIDLYAQRSGYPTLHVAPLVNQPKSRVDFTDFGTEVSSLPEGATEITPVWVVNSASSSGTAPVKVNAFGDLTPVPMDSIPTESSTNLITSGAIKTALDNAVANDNKRYPFGVRQNRATSYGYRLFNVKFSTAQSSTNVRISGNIVVGTTGNNEHISFDLVIANVNTVENNPSSIKLLTTSTRLGSRVVRLAYKRPSNWNDGLDVFILWNAEGTATAANDTYGWEITQQEATKPSGVEVKDENLTSALTGFTLDSPRTFAITEGTSAIGSTSVPVYANVNGVITPCTDDFVHDGDVTSTYSSTGTAPVNGKAVAAAINALDVTDISGFGAGKTLATLKEENGKISATFQNISITKSQVSDFSHTHGNIQNGGTLQTNDITIANGDKLVVTDSSDTGKVARASIAFDGSTATKALTQKGTWETFNNYSLPLAASGTRGGIQIGYSESGTNYAVKLSSEKAYVTVPWTDTKVTQTKDDSGTTAYPLLMAGAADPNGTATTARYDSGVKLTPSTNTISANISGNAATAGTADKAVADHSGNNIEETYAKKTETEAAISNSVDQTYSPTSTKAQSGVAVNEAFKTRETSGSGDSYTYLGMKTTYKGTENLYWKLVSFNAVSNYWTLQFEVDVSNGRKGDTSYDTETYETKRLTICGMRPGAVTYAHELRYVAQGTDANRGYKNNIYYEISSNNLVTVYIKAIDRPNETQICRLKDVINFKGISNITWHAPVNDAGTQPTNPVKFKEVFPAIASTETNVGSDSVPVYVNKGKPIVCNSSNLKAGKDDDGNVIKNTYAKKTELDSKGIVINKIDGENVICFE